ncbi:hypothetical protein B1T47_06640, partial [Mycobacterium kansasii]|uniref:hypothetical protein n=1 Tax=Mycobacterium kansasii TaxID=1768 RepID=UPI0009EF7C2C
GDTNIATAATVVGNANNGVAAGADGSLNIASAATVVGDGNSAAILATASGDTNIATAATVVGDHGGGCRQWWGCGGVER